MEEGLKMPGVIETRVWTRGTGDISKKKKTKCLHGKLGNGEGSGIGTKGGSEGEKNDVQDQRAVIDG